MTVEIRELADEDIALAVALWHATGLTRPYNPPEADARFALNGPASTILGAWDGAELAGTVMLGHDGHRGWVYYLAVDPARHGTGIGRLLMEQAERWMQARGVPKLQLMVRGSNRQARGFYERLGYELNDVVVLGRRLDD